MAFRTLDVNPGRADVHITTRGSKWLWAVCALFTVSALAAFGMSFMRPRTHRLFHYISASIFLIAAISYFTMASNLGWTPIGVQFRRDDPKVRGLFRQIYYARYIDWFLTTPLLLLQLLLTAALPWPTILFVLLLDMVMIVCGLIGALVRSSYKWGYYAFGLAALFGILYHVLGTGRNHARPLGSDVSKAYTTAAGLLMFLWLLYPIAWGLSEGGNRISLDSEVIFYGILDILSKVGVCFLLLFAHNKIEPARLGIRIRDYEDSTWPHNRGGLTGTEKHVHPHNGVHDPTATTVPVTTAV